MLEIRKRILDLKERFGIEDLKRGGRLAKKLGVHNSVITRLIDLKSFPTIENIITICQNAGISSDYLLFGKKLQPSLQEFCSEHYEGRPLESLETVLLFEVIETVDEVVINQRQKLSVRQTARLVALVYEHCRRKRERPDADLVEKYLLLKD